FSHGFHGMTLGSLAATANQAFRQWAGVPLTDVVRLPFEAAPGGRTGIADYAAALRDPSSGVTPPAAFLVEPVQAEGGVYEVGRDVLHEIQELAVEVGALFVVVGAAAAVGRPGGYFSGAGMELGPDLIVLARGLGCFRTPIAMAVNKREVDAPG